MPVEMCGFYNLSIIVQAIENFYRFFPWVALPLF